VIKSRPASCGELTLCRMLGKSLPAVRALLTRYRPDGWYDPDGSVAPNGIAGTVAINAITAVLIDSGYRCWSLFINNRKTVAECAAFAAKRNPGEPIIGYISHHAFIMQDGRIYDPEFPRGIPAADAPYHHEPVELLTRIRPCPGRSSWAGGDNV
jgi:hypothetical protein